MSGEETGAYVKCLLIAPGHPWALEGCSLQKTGIAQCTVRPFPLWLGDAGSLEVFRHRLDLGQTTNPMIRALNWLKQKRILVSRKARPV